MKRAIRCVNDNNMATLILKNKYLQLIKSIKLGMDWRYGSNR